MSSSIKRRVAGFAGVLSVLSFAFFNSAARAGTITTGSITTDTDIVNTGGTLIAAQNLGGTGTPNVNGIAHANSNSLYSPVNFSGNFGNPVGFAGDLFTLLDGLAGTTNANEPGVISVGGLNVGSDYLFQAYWLVNNGEGRTLDISFDTGDLQNGIVQGTQAAPVLISYEFQATSATLNASVAGNGADGNVFLSGFSLQEVPPVPTAPEPSSFLLAAMAICGLSVRRRRRR